METVDWWEQINWIDVFITSGFLATMLGTFLKWRNDKKKAPLERAQVENGIAQENVTSAMSISAEYREQLRVVKEAMREDYERQRERHQEELEAMRRHHESALELLRTRLDSLENSNTELRTKVTRLERDDRNSQAELVKQHTRIGKLESNLTSAKDTVITLITYIKDHPNVATGEIPIVDFTIFDV